MFCVDGILHMMLTVFAVSVDSEIWTRAKWSSFAWVIWRFYSQIWLLEYRGIWCAKRDQSTEQCLVSTRRGLPGDRCTWSSSTCLFSSCWWKTLWNCQETCGKGSHPDTRMFTSHIYCQIDVVHQYNLHEWIISLMPTTGKAAPRMGLKRRSEGIITLRA